MLMRLQQANSLSSKYKHMGLWILFLYLQRYALGLSYLITNMGSNYMLLYLWIEYLTTEHEYMGQIIMFLYLCAQRLPYFTSILESGFLLMLM